MTALLSNMPLPLLGKELAEQAGRRRTYVVRTLYVATAAVLFCVYFYSVFARESVALVALGSGRDMFNFVVAAQLVAVFVFLPAMMSGVISREREHGTLDLLLVTDMAPTEIVLQKYLSRLVPIFTYLLLSMPLLALAYAFGGTTLNLVWGTIVLVLLACVVVGALSLAISSMAISSTSAMLCATGISVACGCEFGYLWMSGRIAFSAVSAKTLLIWAAASAGLTLLLLALTTIAVRRSARGGARGVLRAMRHPLLSLKMWLDEGVTRRRARHGLGPLLTGRPIAWRERKKRIYGTGMGKAVAIAFLEVPLVVILLSYVASAGSGWEGGSRVLSIMAGALWLLMALLVTGTASNALSAERSDRTIELLIVTPLTGGEVVQQKAQGIRPLMGVLAVPILTVHAFQAASIGLQCYNELLPILYFASACAALFVFMRTLWWLSFWIGLRARSPMHGTMSALGAVVAWVSLPVLVAWVPVLGGLAFAGTVLAIFIGAGNVPREGCGIGGCLLLLGCGIVVLWGLASQGFFWPAALLSPATIVVGLEAIAKDSEEWMAVIILVLGGWLGLAAWLLAFFRARCLRQADLYLGRPYRSRDDVTDPVMGAWR